MPKIEIDYSNTIIYKITCKDLTVKDVYVGHTTNFVQRKHAHKQSCINDKSPNYTCKLYDVMRNNGGWDNWKMEIINFFNCQDHYEARQKEQEYFVSLNATLNSIEPMPKSKLKLTTVTENTEKKTFYCENCDYKCIKESNFNRHLSSVKHSLIHNLYKMDTNEKENTNKFLCNCGKKYTYSQGLSKHKNDCKNKNQTSDINNFSNKELIMMLIKEQAELKKLIIDIYIK